MFHSLERRSIQGSTFLFKGGADPSKEKDGSLRKAIVTAYNQTGEQEQEPAAQALRFKPAASAQKVESVPGQQLYPTATEDKKKSARRMNLMRGGVSHI